MAYGAFIDTTDQTNPTPNIARPIRFDTTVFASGVTIVDGTRIAVDSAGICDIQFSAQIIKAAAGVDTVDIWFSRNGVFEPFSTTRITMDERNNANVAAWNTFLELGAGEYAELYWSSPDTPLSFPTITAVTGPDRPAIPSLILTVEQVRRVFLGDRPTDVASAVFLN
jgi:hypothetical protein